MRREQKPRGRHRRVVLVAVGAIAVVALVTGVILRRPAGRAAALARSEAGAPELYARPLAVDVNGDGVEDIVYVAAIDTGHESSSEDGEDVHGKEHGRYHPFVQAIDGKDGKVLYSLALGKAYVSLGTEAQAAERVVLLAQKSRLGVARVKTTGSVALSIHDLASGKELKELSFAAATGRACHNAGGPPLGGTFHFERTGSGSGTTVDLERETATVAKASACGAIDTPTVADVPLATGITDRTRWTARFSHEMKLRGTGAPFGGRTVVQSGALGVLVDDASLRGAAEAAPASITITSDSDVGAATGRDNTKITVAALDLAAGTTRFQRSLASLGLTTQVVDHIEGTDRGPLLFFGGSGGLALLEPTRGDKVWSLALPKGHRISSYTMSKTRAYLHVFGPDQAIYAFLSKKLGSRILVVDLETGTYVRSVPNGSLEPEPSRAVDTPR